MEKTFKIHTIGGVIARERSSATEAISLSASRLPRRPWPPRSDTLYDFYLLSPLGL